MVRYICDNILVDDINSEIKASYTDSASITREVFINFDSYIEFVNHCGGLEFITLD